MDLRQLEIIRAIAETGSFTAAGHKLHVSQSAISRQILLLEDELKTPVFLRIGRRIKRLDRNAFGCANEADIFAHLPGCDECTRCVKLLHVFGFVIGNEDIALCIHRNTCGVFKISAAAAITAELHQEIAFIIEFLHKGIAIALEMGEKPDILFTVTPNNLDELDAAYSRYVEEMGLILILNPIFEYNGVGESLGKSQMDMLRPWGHRPGVYLNTAFLDLRSTGGNHIDKPNCKAGSSTIVISPENKLVLPCYHLGLEEIPIDGKLHQLWKSEAVQSKVRLEGRAPGCEGCVINCYMEPSMAVEMNTFWWKSIRSTLRYSLQKWVYA